MGRPLPEPESSRLIDCGVVGDVIFEVRDQIAIFTLNRPERGNSLTLGVHAELREGWERVKSDSEIRVAIVTGAGDRHFCTGADVERLETIAARQGRPPGQRPKAMESLSWTPLGAGVRKPTLTAINGTVAGAGFYFPALTDFAIASDRATFVDAHVSTGQVSALQAISLIRRTAFAEILSMALMGRLRRLDAQRAYEIGLVTEVVPHSKLMERAMEIGERIARNAPATMMETKRAMWAGLQRMWGS